MSHLAQGKRRDRRRLTLRGRLVATAFAGVGVVAQAAAAQATTPAAEPPPAAPVVAPTEAVTLPTAAATVFVPGLPPEPRVRAALTALPEIKIARAGIEAENANRRRLDAGPYEWSVRVSGQRRRDRELGQDFPEKHIQVERPLRWFGKANADRQIGEQGVQHAYAALGDAWHEAGRSLMRAWFDWRREARAAVLLAEQAELMQRQADIAQRRVKAGDAALTEANTARVERERYVAAARQARARADQMRYELAAHYPGLLPEDGAEAADAGARAEPVALEGDDEGWLARALDDNHEIELAESEARRARLTAERAALERMPDPTVAVFTGQELGTQQRITGFALTIPIPGEARRAYADAGAATAVAAEARLLQTRTRVERELRKLLMQARAAFVAWQRLAEADRLARGNADLLARAYALGESALSETLFARRQALDARLAAEQARYDALEAYARVHLDAHQLWVLDEERN